MEKITHQILKLLNLPHSPEGIDIWRRSSLSNNIKETETVRCALSRVSDIRYSSDVIYTIRNVSIIYILLEFASLAATIKLILNTNTRKIYFSRSIYNHRTLS